ncbi:MAG: hypothetical protein R8M14_04600 [Ghiorsea sp.]
MSLNFAPKPFITFSLLAITLAILMNIYLALQEPSLGIQWASNTQNNALFIAKVYPDSPAEKAGLHAGVVIKSIRAKDLVQPLSASILTEEPDNLGKYSDASIFFSQQDNVANILKHEHISLEAKTGEQFTLQPTSRHLSWLPVMYWFQLICGLLSFFAGIAVFAFRNKDVASQIYAFNGLSFSFLTFAAALYSGRELAIAPELFRNLSAINHLGALLFTASFIGIAWHVPKQLTTFPLTKALFILYSLFWLADTLRWQTESPDTWVQLPILLGLLASIIIAIIQWRKCKQRPDDKQTLRWLLLSLFVPGILFLSLTILLQLLGIQLIVPQGYAFGILLVMYLGISLGIIRFALFELDKWWTHIWLWISTGIIFISIDVLFAALLQLNDMTSTLISLALVGFMYIPLRQRLFSHILKAKEISLEVLIPQVLNLVTHANNPQSLEQQWHLLLNKAFSPLSLKEDYQTQNENVILYNNGTTLFVPDIGLGSPLSLKYANQGARLFSKADITALNSLIQMVKKALIDSQAYQKGIAQERSRIAEDLHDDLGAKLLSLVYKSETPEQKKLAQQAMGVLRQVISSSHDEQILFPEQVRIWKRECLRRASEHHVELEWKQYGVHTKHQIPVMISTQLTKVFREAMSNALKHGDADKICVRLQVKRSTLFISVRNYGKTLCETQTRGSGRSNMKRRMKNIEGFIRWKGRKNGGCHVAWISPKMEGLHDK